jgi:hypothetical protein
LKSLKKGIDLRHTLIDAFDETFHVVSHTVSLSVVIL